MPFDSDNTYFGQQNHLSSEGQGSSEAKSDLWKQGENAATLTPETPPTMHCGDAYYALRWCLNGKFFKYVTDAAMQASFTSASCHHSLKFIFWLQNSLLRQ